MVNLHKKLNYVREKLSRAKVQSLNITDTKYFDMKDPEVRGELRDLREQIHYLSIEENLLRFLEKLLDKTGVDLEKSPFFE